MPPSLDGAIARIVRADIHLDELKTIVEEFRKANENKIFTQQQLHTGNFKIGFVRRVKIGDIEIPIEIAIITGEAIYNLRSALDYLIYELAWKDSGREQTGTQFPIEDFRVDPKDKKRGFEAQRKKSLAGLSNTHIDSIEKLQPYMGCEWTKTLRTISNPDKHRKLTAIKGCGMATSVIEHGASGTLNDHPSKMLIRGTGAAYTDINLDVQYALDITLPDGGILLVTLEILKREVAATIDSFKPEFK